VSQPSVSAQVRRLEQELDHTLFERTTRVVRATGAAEELLPRARAALAAMEDVWIAADELRGLLRGRVAFGTITSSPAVVPELLAAFHRTHPHVQITLTEGNSDDLLSALGSGALDVALTSLAAAPPAGISAEVVVEEAFVAAVAPTHRLANRKRIAIKELAAETLISLPPGTGARSALNHAYATAGLEPRISFEASDPAVLAQLAARGLGVAVVPRSLTETPGLCAVETRPAMRGSLALTWRAVGPLAPAARAFIDTAKRALADAAQPASGGARMAR
jgi:DNA-binding transcriptional LysR family regulator